MFNRPPWRISGDKLPDRDSLSFILQEAELRRRSYKLIPPSPLTKRLTVITTGNLEKFQREALQKRRAQEREKKRTGLIARVRQLMEEVKGLEGEQ